MPEAEIFIGLLNDVKFLCDLFSLQEIFPEREARKFERMMVEKYSGEARPFFVGVRLLADGTLS